MTGFTAEELRELLAFDKAVDDEKITLDEWRESTLRDLEFRQSKKRKSDREYYITHRQECLARSKEWSGIHPERMKEYYAQYRMDHLEERRLYDATYYASNRDSIRKKQSKRLAENRDEINAKRREKRAANAGDVRARERAYWREHADIINARRRERYKQKKKTVISSGG